MIRGYDKLETLVKKHGELLASGALSLPPESGESVILTSGNDREEELDTYDHAEELKEDSSGHFYGARIISQPTIETIEETLHNPEIASISYIGHGRFDALILPYGSSLSGSVLTWSVLGNKVLHLKQGWFEQRTCTKIERPDRRVVIPAASFVMANQTKILMPMDMEFDSHYFTYQHVNPLLTNPYTKALNSADELLAPALSK